MERHASEVSVRSTATRLTVFDCRTRPVVRLGSVGHRTSCVYSRVVGVPTDDVTSGCVALVYLVSPSSTTKRGARRINLRGDLSGTWRTTSGVARGRDPTTTTVSTGSDERLSVSVE